MTYLIDGLAVFKLDLSQLTSSGEAAGATFNLLIYARNLKGESEKTLLENIAFNDAARRTGNVNLLVYSVPLILLNALAKPKFAGFESSDQMQLVYG